jgi:hypothetical protein
MQYEVWVSHLANYCIYPKVGDKCFDMTEYTGLVAAICVKHYRVGWEVFGGGRAGVDRGAPCTMTCSVCCWSQVE